MSGCWRIDRGLSLKLKDPRGDPSTTRLFRKSRGTERCQNRPEVTGRSASTAVKAESTSDRQPLTVWETWSGECRAFYHHLSSVVREEGDHWASRSSSQSSQAFLAVVSGSLFIGGVVTDVIRPEAVKTDPSSAIEREFLWARVTERSLRNIERWSWSFK